MQILINHIGYELTRSKRAVVKGKAADEAGEFRVVDKASGQVVHRGKAERTGPVHKWRDWHFWTIDFSQFDKEGTYYLECDTSDGTLRSYEFEVADYLLGIQSFSDAIYYLKSQRVVGDLDKADGNVPFSGPRAGRHDAHGGWFDASGDYGKHLSHLSHSTYFNPQQGAFTAWALFKVHEILESLENPHYYQVKRRLLAEAMYGADYMYRMRAPSGSFFQSVMGRGPFKRAEHRAVSFSFRGSSSQFGRAATACEETVTDENYETAFRQGAGMAIAALAFASRHSYPGDYSREQYLQAAKDSYDYMEANNYKYTNDGKDNLLDVYCQLTALTELYKATLDPYYAHKARQKAEDLMAAQVSYEKWQDYWQVNDEGRPFFHAADAGLPIVALMNYLEIERDPKTRARVLDVAKRAMRFEVGITEEVSNPFGLARQFVQRKDGTRKTAFFFPHDTEAAPWWQGENARLASLATAARLVAKHLDEGDELRGKLCSYATDQLNWILGLNPFDSCMQQGSGRNSPRYYFTTGFDYLNAPGGICNGITSGLFDEEDIDLYLTSEPGVVNDNWRWAEQWIPHGTWYIYAVVLGIRG